MIFKVDEGSTWGVEVYDIIFRTYVLLDFELTAKIFVNFSSFKNWFFFPQFWFSK